MAKADIHEVNTKEKVELISQGLVFDDDTKIIEVVLSEKNLLSLLSKLYIDGSKRTLYNGDVPEHHLLKLVAEDDEAHYGERAHGPGIMHPATEELITELRSTLRGWEDKHKIVSLFNQGAGIA